VGIRFGNHVLGENFHSLPFDALKKNIVKTNFLQYQSVVSAVSKMKSICARTQEETNSAEDLNNRLASRVLQVSLQFTYHANCFHST